MQLDRKNSFIVFLLLIAVIHISFALPVYRPTEEASQSLKKRIQSWLQELSGENDKQAIENLKKVGHLAIPQILESLQSKNPAVKRKLLEILQEFYIPDLTHIFQEILENEAEDARNREIAGLALGKYTNATILRVLEKYSTHADTRIQRATGHSICRNTTTIGIPFLIRLLKHWNTELQGLAYKQLRTITNQKQLPAKYEVWEKWWNDHQEIWEEEKK